MKQTLRRLYEQETDRLLSSNIQDAKIDAMWLLLDLMKISRLDYILHCEENVDRTIIDHYIKLIDRRLKGEPVQYIIGNQEFMGLAFKVNPDVLIPRQDTEILVETLIDLLKTSEGTVLDVGTGTGCILISLIKSCPHLKGVGLDISIQALKTAKVNGELNQVNDKINWIKSDLLSNLTKKDYNKFVCIVSNPPYIPSGEIKNLMQEVKNHEPINALDGGQDGLDYYRQISKQAYQYLKDKGIIAYEVGHDQGFCVKEILEENGYKNINILKDLTGINRVVYGLK